MRRRDKEKMELPKNYQAISEAEQTSLDGGVNIGMKQSYLNKNVCMRMGGEWAKNWNRVTATQIAHEIFGHAVGYYDFATVLKIIPDGNGGNFYNHVKDGVDINNEVDRYQKYFDIIWNVVPSR